MPTIKSQIELNKNYVWRINVEITKFTLKLTQDPHRGSGSPFCSIWFFFLPNILFYVRLPQNRFSSSFFECRFSSLFFECRFLSIMYLEQEDTPRTNQKENPNCKETLKQLQIALELHGLLQGTTLNYFSVTSNTCKGEFLVLGRKKNIIFFNVKLANFSIFKNSYLYLSCTIVAWVRERKQLEKKHNIYPWTVSRIRTKKHALIRVGWTANNNQRDVLNY